MDQVDRSTEALAQRRQHVMVGLAGLLACIFFVLDLHLPLGVANAVLYSVVVLLSSASQYRWLPVVTATACSLLTTIAVPFSPRVPGLPSWFEWVNHLFSLFGIWAPVLFVYQRRHIESRLCHFSCLYHVCLFRMECLYLYCRVAGKSI